MRAAINIGGGRRKRTVHPSETQSFVTIEHIGVRSGADLNPFSGESQGRR